MKEITNNIILSFAEDLQATPEAEKINNLWERGLITYCEAVKMLIQAAENAQYYFIIEYKTQTGKRFKPLDDIEREYTEAAQELDRLMEAAPHLLFRLKKKPKFTTNLF